MDLFETNYGFKAVKSDLNIENQYDDERPKMGGNCIVMSPNHTYIHNI